MSFLRMLPTLQMAFMIGVVGIGAVLASPSDALFLALLPALGFMIIIMRPAPDSRESRKAFDRSFHIAMGTLSVASVAMFISVWRPDGSAIVVAILWSVVVALVLSIPVFFYVDTPTDAKPGLVESERYVRGRWARFKANWMRETFATILFVFAVWVYVTDPLVTSGFVAMALMFVAIESGSGFAQSILEYRRNWAQHFWRQVAWHALIGAFIVATIWFGFFAETTFDLSRETVAFVLLPLFVSIGLADRRRKQTQSNEPV